MLEFNKFCLTVPEVLLRLLLRLLFAGESSVVEGSLGAVLEIVNLRLRPLASLTSAVVIVATLLSKLESMVAVTTFCIKAFCLAANSGSREREDLLEATGSEVEGLKKVAVSFYLHSQILDRAERYRRADHQHY